MVAIEFGKFFRAQGVQFARVLTQTFRSALLRYGAAILAVCVGFCGRWLIERYGLGPYRFPAFQCAVIVSALLGGLGPGLLAVLLSSIGWAYFLPPAGFYALRETADVVNLFSVTGVNIVIVWAFAVARRQIFLSAHTVEAGQNKHPLIRRSAKIILFMAEEAVDSPGSIRSGRHVILGVIVCLAALLLTFGIWGTFTPGGTAYFPDEAWLIPLISLASAPVLIIFGVGFIPFDPAVREADRIIKPDGVVKM